MYNKKLLLFLLGIAIGFAVHHYTTKNKTNVKIVQVDEDKAIVEVEGFRKGGLPRPDRSNLPYKPSKYYHGRMYHSDI